MAISQVFLDPKSEKVSDGFSVTEMRAHMTNLPAEYQTNKARHKHTHTKTKDTQSNSVNK